MRESTASADEMGTGEDLMTAVVTSESGRARRLRRDGDADVPAAGDENSLQSWASEGLIKEKMVRKLTSRRFLRRLRDGLISSACATHLGPF